MERKHECYEQEIFIRSDLGAQECENSQLAIAGASCRWNGKSQTCIDLHSLSGIDLQSPKECADPVLKPTYEECEWGYEYCYPTYESY